MAVGRKKMEVTAEAGWLGRAGGATQSVLWTTCQGGWGGARLGWGADAVDGSKEGMQHLPVAAAAAAAQLVDTAVVGCVVVVVVVVVVTAAEAAQAAVQSLGRAAAALHCPAPSAGGRGWTGGGHPAQAPAASRGGGDGCSGAVQDQHRNAFKWLQWCCAGSA